MKKSTPRKKSDPAAELAAAGVMLLRSTARLLEHAEKVRSDRDQLIRLLAKFDPLLPKLR